ncbi:ATP-binding protein [Leptospira barantonii]|uniref:ATP-binding protein n=1 Tax=Leptospira barantonii TaxID=2023184 RepID=A0ABX4NLA5_9LEPT|nr:ATP-binding protein [Leptospira barantonii]PJZ57457.1 hypothetical protein CH367_08870 [Leptospira barantonii]
MTNKPEPDKVQASPTKRFFVEMLTRDIELEDAILDLIDNCLDGAIRKIGKNNLSNTPEPYKGYFAEIIFDKSSFTIKDNCGGISLSIAKEVAFKLGRPNNSNNNSSHTIGIYGIGMKRAIFKICSEATVISATENENFEVSIPKEWMENDNEWELELKHNSKNQSEIGTTIKMKHIRPEIALKFANSNLNFYSELIQRISSHYSLILEKGFKILVNSYDVKPKSIQFIANFDSDSNNNQTFQPYYYQGKSGKVTIDIVIGFYRPMPSAEEIEDDQEGRHSAEQAGITILCNDRVVLESDKTRLTGWGEETVPNFHNQFIAIAGIVQYSSDDASLLPLTTTKRGIDLGSDLYLYTKKFMREGIRTFTQYTNKWKLNISEEKKHRPNQNYSPKDILSKLSKQKNTNWTKDKSSGNKYDGKRFIPKLPEPERDSAEFKVIRFTKKIKDIEKVSNILFDIKDEKPATVGEAAFDFVLKGSKKK